jgi:EAL domain-containing protein (putative c-di-GMP-specific phosphodiesterase class I)
MPELAGQVVAALQAGKIKAWVQPKVALIPRKVIGGEVLARWVHPDHGVIAPGRFMHLIEQQGLKDELLLRQLDAVLQAMRDWPRRLTAGFNVDVRQLCNLVLIGEACRRVIDA